MTTSICNDAITLTSISDVQITSLIDTRDMGIYYIAKLKDSKC